MNKYLSRVTTSARGEVFNPLIWPFLVATFAYGLGFIAFGGTPAIFHSSLYIAMLKLWTPLPILWGFTAIAVIIVGLTFLMFRIPPAGKISGLVGFMIWVFAAFCWGFNGAFIPLLSVALPNLYFWIWQYLSLSDFRRQEASDKQTMQDYDDGKYDQQNGDHGVASGKEREDNRGVDRQ